MKIALLGDIGLFGKFCVRNGINPEEYFLDFINKTKDCDFIVGNLETPFSEKFKEYTAKSACIGSFKENVEIINSLNVKYVNLANNHTGDFGAEGYKLTKKLLSDNHIKYFGVEGIKEYLEYDDNRICFSGFCNMDSNPVYLSKPEKNNDIGVNVVDVDNVVESLKESNSAGYLNIVAFHSGLEHVNLPGKADIYFARYLAESYDYILYGHHPHVVQAYEKFNNSHLFYSLGNFCFDDVYSSASKKPLVKMTEANKIGLVPILTIENNIVVHIENVWTYLGKDRMEIIDTDSSGIIDAVKNIRLRDIDKVEADRKDMLSAWYSERKRKRSFAWYMKRLRFKYINLFFNAKRNRKLYEKHYLNKLKQRGII